MIGLDLVAIQFELAEGKRRGELGLDAALAPRGIGIEVRANAETVDETGQPIRARGRSRQ